MADSMELSVHHDTQEMFETFDLADEEQVIAELAGRVTDKFVYSFKQGGQDVTGLSYAGTNWAVREYAKQGEVIRVSPDVHFKSDPSDPDYVIVIVSAQRFMVNKETGQEIGLDTRLGTCRQAKFMKKRKFNDSGEVIGEERVEDGFFASKATSKASRNAMQALIPTDIVKKLIQKAIESKNGKAVQPRGDAKASTGKQQAQRTAPASQGTQAAPAQAPATTPPPSSPAQSAAAATPPPPPATAASAAAPAPAPAAAPAQAPAPPPPAAEASAPAPAAAKPKQDKNTMIQKFDAMLKGLYGVTDGAAARQKALPLTGTVNISEFPEDKLRTLGNALIGVTKKLNRIEGHRILANNDNKVLWEGPAPAAPAPAPAAAAPAEGEPEMF